MAFGRAALSLSRKTRGGEHRMIPGRQVENRDRRECRDRDPDLPMVDRRGVKETIDLTLKNGEVHENGL